MPIVKIVSVTLFLTINIQKTAIRLHIYKKIGYIALAKEERL